ncbi:protein WVD2-like 7 [Ipomoea triloba]|uniref:protein WVD2-like 7 n=1 Tax=Ipomoea triloba TaxID=35885 RepID=UPI00125D8FDD|nr:protein WVD2-like 7 [Ipomoea triloba]XP_031124689.1 protein WVD2-like 7 [Ipomoea triloba]XP_031124691.1 protein WVD2-like 7 [Ipomoea triloba]XP_031124692.1 protein WVD2-like 7 [Ipomoea triloba]XP_031124693.1 protein WVD2-like 7 [Ipomoea triloba]XP_031124694.1 protein WVD2-like 7 [Ipomoea triloba]
MMSESAASSRALEVSVSFGKFESDSLSWEKWSSFSPNKYLEEVEKCSTPGSVAQKKAYFEAHYKKIAARKVDQLEEPEKLVEVEPDNLRSEESSKQEARFEVVENGFRPSNGDERSKAEVQLEPTIICPLDSEIANESNDAAIAIAIDIVCNEGSLVEEAAKEDLICNEGSPEISNGDEIARVEEGQETSQKNPRDDVMVEQKKVDNDSSKSSGKKDKNLKGHMKASDRKIHPSMNDSTSAWTKKKLASPALKSSKVTTSRVSPAPSSKLGSPSLPPTKKANGSSLQEIKNTPVTKTKKLAPPRSVVSPQPSTRIQNGSSLHRSKNSPVTDNKRVARTSLHMSLSLSPANSAASQNMMRRSVITETGPAKPVESRIAMGRSLIMDRMGDKEIVKRAFKTFRNSFNEMKSSGDKSYSGSGQMTSKGPEQKISTSLTPSGENGRLGKPNQRVTTQKGQSGTKSSSVSSRAPMDAGVERRKMITNKPSIGSTNDGTNEILKKEGAKPRTQRPIK